MAKNAARKAVSPSAPSPRVMRVVTHPVADTLIHERTRLAIVSSLAVNESLSFSELKNLLAITDGNLSIHARKLEDAGYVLCQKSFEGRTPKTTFSLSSAGREALRGYLDHMERLIEAARP
ncbi:MAG: transcriptional regulator [Bryobacterales bacterium]|nr:transcriptional regulator [Bryobacterales bacterium]